MAKTQITFAKIVSHPTDLSWSQTYTAGKVAALFSLNATDESALQKSEFSSLHLLGKDLLSTFEAEYFTLETKTLDSIKIAVQTTCDKISPDIQATIIVTAIVENILYVFVFGKGIVLLKRANETGILLENNQENKEQKHVQAASGFLKPGDLFILATEEFENDFAEELTTEIKTSSSPIDIAEALSPHIRRIKHGNAAAILFSYDEESPSPLLHTPLPEKKEIEPEDNDEEIISEEPGEEEKPKKSLHISRPHFPHVSFLSRRIIFLVIALLLVAVLISSIFIAMQKQKAKQQQALFQSKIIPAQKKYDEAQSLLSLNKQTARADLQEAQTMVQEAKGSFPPDSQESKTANELLSKINDQLTSLSQIQSVPVDQANESDSPLLATEMKQNSNYVVQDDKKIYYADTTGILAIDKNTQKTSTIIKNNNDWSDIGGLGVYFGNVYLVDKKANTVDKFVAAANGFGKTNYFSSTHADISQATAMAIDGSVWILNGDGNVLKFTKGKPDDFQLKSLNKPLSHPTRIYTDIDAKNVYILDPSNSRIVVFGKDGVFQTDYQADNFAKAKDFDVREKDKKIFILADNKILKITLK